MNAQTEPSEPTPEAALEALLEGNRRWTEGRSNHPHQSAERREAVASAQAPMAAVFTCLDSRVPPEIVFDCGVGDLAVIRTGAHVLDNDVVLDSLAFCAVELRTPLIMVMGHQRCGAISAAAHSTGDGSFRAILDALAPARRAALQTHTPEDFVERMVRAHTRLTVNQLAALPEISALVTEGRLRVLGSYYSLQTGAVAILD
jgi:carbonic anhydrase